MITITARRFVAGALTVVGFGCGGSDPTGTIPVGATLSLTLTGLSPVDATSGGRYEAWVVDRMGTAHSLGPVDPASSSITLSNTTPDVASFLITYEPRGDTDPGPSPHQLLAG